MGGGIGVAARRAGRARSHSPGQNAPAEGDKQRPAKPTVALPTLRGQGPHIRNQFMVEGYMAMWPHAGPANWPSVHVSSDAFQGSLQLMYCANQFHSLTKQQPM